MVQPASTAFSSAKPHQGAADTTLSGFFLDHDGAETRNALRLVKPFHNVKTRKSHDMAIDLGDKGVMTLLSGKCDYLLGYLFWVNPLSKASPD